jgi:leader peptidase (prepilin peptidase)/N-methyltransferase
MVLGAVLGASRLTPAYWLCGVLGVALAIVDVRTQRLPYAMGGVLYASCAVAFVVSAAGSGDASPLVRAVLAAALAFTGFLVLALAFAGQLGLGDVVLVGWVAFSLGWFGWGVAAVGLLAGLILQALVGILFLARPGPKRALPMGPALLIGWLVGVLIAAW